LFNQTNVFKLLECWNDEPNKRPSIHEVVNRLRIFSKLMANENLIPNSTRNGDIWSKLFRLFLRKIKIILKYLLIGIKKLLEMGHLIAMHCIFIWRWCFRKPSKSF
jgi:hypothetical protein